jgi:hypothetical protein
MCLVGSLLESSRMIDKTEQSKERGLVEDHGVHGVRRRTRACLVLLVRQERQGRWPENVVDTTSGYRYDK